MDYILKHLERKIDYYEAANKIRDMADLYRVKTEYGLIFLLAYLWGQNYEILDAETKEYIFGIIRQPSIGSILDIARKMDVNQDVFNNRKINEVINNYPKFRNEKLGHGYIFEDGLNEYLQSFKDMANQIFIACEQLKANYDLIAVTDFSDGVYSGINFKSDGATFLPWACPQEIKEFVLGGVYALAPHNSTYYRLSPFVYLSDKEEFFIFKDIEEILTGKVRYNQTLRTGSFAKEWDELCNQDFRLK